jgi:hypothetical protein
MADAYDVMDAMAALISPAVYPSGTSSPSVSGSDITIFPGWPTQSALDNSIVETNSIVSVFAIPGSTNTTRYPIKNQRIGESSTATLTWAISGITATLDGTVSVPQNVAIIVDNASYAYAVQSTDTLTSIVAALVALIAVDRACTSSGAVINIPASSTIVARVGTASTIAAEWMRQKSRFLITVWCATPANRRTIQSAIKTALAQQHFIAMPDGFAARMRYMSDWPLDTAQKALLYRHDITYEVEYATTVTGTAAQAIVLTAEVFGGVVTPTKNPQIFNF